MILRRSQPQPPPPPSSPWRQRVAAARALIRHHRNDPATERQLDGVEAALERADDDRAAIGAALSQLRPDRVAAELKSALRARDRSEAHIMTLRRRHETVHGLTNQLDAIDQRIESTVADLETLAARTTQTMLGAEPASDLDAQLDQLNLDVTALAAAHEELASLESRPERKQP